MFADRARHPELDQLAGIGVGCKYATESLSPSEYFRHGITAGSEFREIWLNGERLPFCVEAHKAQGWARCYRIHDGYPLHDIFDRPVFDLVYGYIEILFCSPEHSERPLSFCCG